MVSRCGQIGVTSIAFTVGITIGPFADRLYPLDPVGVDKITPSARNSATAIPSIATEKSAMRAIVPFATTTSFSASHVRLCPLAHTSSARIMLRTSIKAVPPHPAGAPPSAPPEQSRPPPPPPRPPRPPPPAAPRPETPAPQVHAQQWNI